MTTERATSTQWREMTGQAITTTCPHMPAWTLHEHNQVNMAIFTTSVVFVQHTVENVAGRKRLARRHRRVAVGLS